MQMQSLSFTYCAVLEHEAPGTVDEPDTHLAFGPQSVSTWHLKLASARMAPSAQ